MTLTLKLPPELERRLADEAGRKGIPIEQYTLQLLNELAPAGDRRDDAVRLLQLWMDHGDAAEQKETGDYLVRALDEDRLSDRKLFPPEMKGVSW
jgi:hypothetical protein